MTERTTPFVCFYCGKENPASESSDEHVIPSSIGGTRNATLTNEVCGKCNAFMDKHVDIVFARDWFIESARLLAGIRHREKLPVINMGQIQWDRHEEVTMYISERGVSVYLVEGTPDGHKRLLVATDETDPEILDITRKLVKSRFPDVPVANDASGRGKPYEEEITKAMIDLGRMLPVKYAVHLTAWHREMAKMALGLSCMVLGAAFILSAEADLLRQFLFENDPVKRAEIPIRGQVGITGNVKPVLTKSWHPGGEQHLFVLIGTSDGLFFTANLFGKFENSIQVAASNRFHPQLGAGTMPGLAWIVDGVQKTAEGPLPLSQFLGSNV